MRDGGDGEDAEDGELVSSRRIGKEGAGAVDALVLPSDTRAMPCLRRLPRNQNCTQVDTAAEMVG